MATSACVGVYCTVQYSTRPFSTPQPLLLRMRPLISSASSRLRYSVLCTVRTGLQHNVFFRHLRGAWVCMSTIVLHPSVAANTCRVLRLCFAAHPRWLQARSMVISQHTRSLPSPSLTGGPLRTRHPVFEQSPSAVDSVSAIYEHPVIM